MGKQQHPHLRRAVANDDPATTDSSAAVRQGHPPHNALTPPDRAQWRGAMFVVLCAICLTVAVGYVIRAAMRNQAIGRASSLLPGAAVNGGPEAVAALSKKPHLFFRMTGLGDSFGKIALVPLDAPDRPPLVTTLQCDRIFFAAGHGICLAGYRGYFAAYEATIFGSDLQAEHTLPLAGLPSRARISPDGRYAAMTVFVSGHSYSDGNFSTQTTLIDLATGAIISDLEQFAVIRDGARFQAPDFNFWGVTFARDSNRFYATLASGHKTYLVEGEISSRQARVLYENVECPSLSPDNTRVAFKKAVVRDGRPMWQISILDLASLQEQPLAAETRSVDDQVEWLDNSHILYGLPDDSLSPTIGDNVWMLPTDGSGPPRIFMPKAASPTVVR